MSASRVVYSRTELLALSDTANSVTLTSDQIKKFDIIEVGDPTPINRRAEEANTGSSTSGANKGGGARETREDNRRQQRNNNTSNARFAPPSRGGFRGNRDQEAFEEGYKYELDRNAELRRDVQETMDRINREEKREESMQAKNAARDERQSAQPGKEEDAGKDELDRILAGMSVGVEKTGPSRPSRFFPTSSEPNSPPAAAAATRSTAEPNPARWGAPTRTDAANWSTAATSAPAANAANASPAGGAVAGGMTFAGGVANMPSSQPTQRAVLPQANSAVAGNSVRQLQSQQLLQQLHPQLQQAQQQPQQQQQQQQSQPQVWRAQDLEDMLRHGKSMPTAAAAPPPPPQFQQPQQQQTVAPTQRSINAADLESMLLQQAQGVSAPKPQQQQHQQPQQQHQPPQQQHQPQQQPMMPSHPSSGGSRTPPQQMQIPAALQGHPQPHPQPMNMGHPNAWMQHAKPQQPMGPVPLMMGAQSTPYFTTQTPLYMGQQASHPQMMYHSPDGRMFVQPQSPPQFQQQQGAQLVYQQQQQHQQQHQQRR